MTESHKLIDFKLDKSQESYISSGPRNIEQKQDTVTQDSRCNTWVSHNIIKCTRCEQDRPQQYFQESPTTCNACQLQEAYSSLALNVKG